METGQTLLFINNPPTLVSTSKDFLTGILGMLLKKDEPVNKELLHLVPGDCVKAQNYKCIGTRAKNFQS